MSIYYMCKYTPVELFAGFGKKAARLDSDLDSFSKADALAHPNLCGYGKGLLEACLGKEVREVVLVNCCDVARRIYDILAEHGKLDFLYLLDLPHKRDKADRWLFEALIRKFVDAYEAYSGIRFDVEKAKQALSEAEGDARPEGSYVSLQGAHGGWHLAEAIQAHFDVPLVDDTCSGARTIRLSEIPDERDAFLSAYSEALFMQTPCMRMRDVKERSAIAEDAAGVIYHTMKFCDYYGFEYAERIASDARPHLKIETDATRQSSGQLATRLDAFSEQLFGGRLKGLEKTEVMQDAKYFAGIDSGSTSTDVVIMDRDRRIIAFSILRTGAGAATGAKRALDEALQQAGIEEAALSAIVSTGYGREHIETGDQAVTEITCHAKGAHFLDPSVRTIIDIGGQDSKVIRIDENGAVENFVMNDKCAAGTGRFLEMMARTMELSMDEMEAIERAWKEDLTISSMCTVFAESEVVSLVANNKASADIIHGLYKAVAQKTAALAARVGVTERVMMTGGVAKNGGLVEELKKKLGTEVIVSEHAQLCGAIGAALVAVDSVTS